MTDRDIIEKQIADHQKAIDDAKEKLAEIDKPKLRHGDYGLATNKAGVEMLVIYDGSPSGKNFYTLTKDGKSYEGIWSENHFESFVRLGNIFDDIADRGKELKEFEVADVYGSSYVVKVEPQAGDDYLLTGNCWFKTTPDGLKKARNYCAKLQQVINFAENHND